MCLAIVGRTRFCTARYGIGVTVTRAVWRWCRRTLPCWIVDRATQRLMRESIRWQRVAKDVLHAMECCGGEGRARVRIAGVARGPFCWLALFCGCFRAGCWCWIHPRSVCSSSLWSARDCRCPRLSEEEEGGVGVYGTEVEEKCEFFCRCVSGSERALCLAVRVSATLCDVRISLVDVACGSWKGGVFVGFQSL